MELLHTQHFHGSISEYFFNKKENKIIEIKTNNKGESKEYKYDFDTFVISNIHNKSSIVNDYSKFRTLNQYRQTKDVFYNN